MTQPYRWMQQILMCTISAMCMMSISLQAQADTLPDAVDPTTAASTRAIAADLLGQLGQKLKASMSSDGPIAAVSV